MDFGNNPSPPSHSSGCMVSATNLHRVTESLGSSFKCSVKAVVESTACLIHLKANFRLILFIIFLLMHEGFK